MTKRDEKQKEFSDIVVQKVRDQGFIHNTAIIATGFGKSKIIIDLIEPLQKLLKFEKILITGNSENLRDINWKNDFAKWGKSDIYDSIVETATYQAAYKWTKDLSKYLIIADEADFAFTQEYGKFFSTYKDCNILAITGYITDSKKSFMDAQLPFIIEYSLEEAQKEGILNKTKIVFVKFDLDKNRNIPVSYEKGAKNFMTSENSSYEYWDKRFISETIKMEEAELEANLTGDWREYRKWKAIRDKSTVRKRTEILYTLKSSVTLTKSIINAILKKNEANKVVIFTTRTDHSKQISKQTYNSKNTKEFNKDVYDGFNSGKYRELVVVDKINRSDNLVGANFAIMTSFHGGDTTLRQRLGQINGL